MAHDLLGALYTLNAAAAWLLEMYWDGNMKRDNGWGKNPPAQDAFILLGKLIKQL